MRIGWVRRTVLTKKGIFIFIPKLEVFLDRLLTMESAPMSCIPCYII